MEQPCIFEAAGFSFFLFLKLKLQTCDYPGVLSFIISSFLKKAWVRRVESQLDRPKWSDAGQTHQCDHCVSWVRALTLHWLFIVHFIYDYTLPLPWKLHSFPYSQVIIWKSLQESPAFSLWLWPFYWLISRLRGHIESSLHSAFLPTGLTPKCMWQLKNFLSS